MDAPGPIKKVPKWALIASVGVVGGVVVMRYRSKSAAAAPTDATAAGDYTQGVASFPATGTVASPVGSAGGDTSSPVDIPGLISSIGNVFAQAQPDWPSILASLPGYAGGGGAPVSTTTAAAPATGDAAPTPPSPVQQAGPSNTPAPAPRPAPVPAATASRPQCSGSFPNYNADRKDCYRVECNPRGHAKGKWHFYAHSDAQRVGNC